MPIPKIFLFFLALLLLVSPASADNIVNSLTVTGDDHAVYSYVSLGGNVLDSLTLKAYSSTTTVRNATFTDVGISTSSSNSSSLYLRAYGSSTSKTINWGENVTNVTGYVVWTARSYTSDGDDYYIATVAVTITSYRVYGEDTSSSGSTLVFSDSEVSPSEIVTYSWDIDPWYTGDYEEVYEGHASTQTYTIVFSGEYEGKSILDDDFLVVVLGSSSGSGTLDVSDYYHNSNFTITGTLNHDATYFPLPPTYSFDESEVLDSDSVSVLMTSTSNNSTDNSTSNNSTSDSSTLTDPTLPDLPDQNGTGTISDPNGTDVVDGGNYSYDPSENGTVNATWVSEYQASVKSVYAPLDNGVTGFLGYVLYPVTAFTGYITTILLLATDILSSVLSMVMAVSVIMTSLFNAVPDKVLMVGSYGLLLDIFAVVLGK